MNDEAITLAVAANSALWVATGYSAFHSPAATRGSRSGNGGHRVGSSAAQAGSWLARVPATSIPLLGAGLQFAAATVRLGWVHALALGLGSWMLIGLVFVPSVNAWPTATTGIARAIGAGGGLLLLAGLVVSCA